MLYKYVRVLISIEEKYYSMFVLLYRKRIPHPSTLLRNIDVIIVVIGTVSLSNISEAFFVYLFPSCPTSIAIAPRSGR